MAITSTSVLRNLISATYDCSIFEDDLKLVVNNFTCSSSKFDSPNNVQQAIKCDNALFGIEVSATLTTKSIHDPTTNQLISSLDDTRYVKFNKPLTSYSLLNSIVQHIVQATDVSTAPIKKFWTVVVYIAEAIQCQTNNDRIRIASMLDELAILMPIIAKVVPVVASKPAVAPAIPVVASKPATTPKPAVPVVVPATHSITESVVAKALLSLRKTKTMPSLYKTNSSAAVDMLNDAKKTLRKVASTTDLPPPPPPIVNNVRTFALPPPPPPIASPVDMSISLNMPPAWPVVTLQDGSVHEIHNQTELMQLMSHLMPPIRTSTRSMPHQRYAPPLPPRPYSRRLHTYDQYLPHYSGYDHNY